MAYHKMRNPRALLKIMYSLWWITQVEELFINDLDLMAS